MLAKIFYQNYYKNFWFKIKLIIYLQLKYKLVARYII